MGKHSLALICIKDIKELTLERNHIDENDVGKPRQNTVPYNNLKVLILEKNTVNVWCVAKFSFLTKSFEITR